ncbi:glycine C-acetyltransferase [Alcaligenes endophyticus]|uniref:2-amino-3-ketobutyrate coenzyme A ligase n=1 Tax=Alcaligenes endophyticus TaxID=1929088 RepID=A0ABT8EFH9_9BURK|nr:glycine C-acetyltransferase [Alcaligenes endophyticus]MCX5590406.1 glycine C-acetyltransferase [Alcaligenes endophyticus]MDN4119930.1 glycine C-acetyltransferase [Alcaligenes endophyticus]
MHKSQFQTHLQAQLDDIRQAGFYKSERVITAAQSTAVNLQEGSQVLNFCANNYLGLADDARIVEAAKNSLDNVGFGMASVRFICGTQSIHTKLEQQLAQYLEKEAAILYSSCFDANVGLFEALLTEQDAIISDELNHASIIDGIRLCKAKRFRYKNNNLHDLEQKLIEADQAGARFKLIATDGVFSMDGIIADLCGICDLADRYGALVMVDDSHAVGFMGAQGRGTPYLCGVQDRVDILTGTFGKALGGASGGYVAASDTIVQILRQRSRPYLFSNALAPSIAAATLRVLELLQSDEGEQRREQLHANSQYFREAMTKLGFELIPGQHPIIPVMLGDARVAAEMAERLLLRQVYVVSFSFPVVPQGLARIRTQMSATHTRAQLDQAIEAFGIVGKELNLI